MICRERQTEWLADLIEEHHGRHRYAHHLVGIYGRGFKAGTNLTIGSPATLLSNLLKERGWDVRVFDPHIDAGPCPFDWAGVYFVATNHPEFASAGWRYPEGSVVLDPWRYIPRRAGADVVHIGVDEQLWTKRA